MKNDQNQKNIEKLTAWVNKQEAKYLKKIKKENDKKKKLSSISKKQVKGDYVIANTAATVNMGVKDYVKSNSNKKFENIGDMIMFYEGKSGKTGPAVYADWMTKQYYYSIVNGKIKRPDKKVAIGLAIAFGLKAAEMKSFVENFGYSFPNEKRDLVVEYFCLFGDYDTKRIEKGTQQEVDRAKGRQTMSNISALDDLIYTFDKNMDLIGSKKEN